MDILSDWQDWETKFLGEKVKMQLLDLETQDYLFLMEHMGNIDEIEQNFERGMRLYKVVVNVAEIFPKYVRNIQNLTMNGQPVEPEMVCKKQQLADLALGILTRLIYISTATKPDEKNLSEPSDVPPQLKKVSKI